MSLPNVLYLHSHDTGRYVQPYGYPVPTPNIQHLADQGVLFRQAFCAAPVCSGSRAALLTGQSTHATGMLGLAHRGYRLTHPERHMVHVLRDAGYWSGLIGEQHVSADPRDVGYDHVVEVDSTKVSDVAPAATRLIAERAGAEQPFFLSVGFFETHREYFEPSSVRDALYSRPPENIVDNVMTRRDMASFRASARSLDQGVGTVLNALEEHELVDDTLVILTTDHGLAFPDAKCTMYDRGIGVMLIDARSRRLRARARARRAREPSRRVSHDLRRGRDRAARHGSRVRRSSRSWPARSTRSTTRSSPRSRTTRRTSRSGPCAPAATSTCVASTSEHPARVLANVDDGLTKDLLLAAGWGEVDPPVEALFDLWIDPTEGTNRIDDPALARRRSRTCGRGCTTGWSGPTTRCWTVRSHRLRAPSSTRSTSSRRTTRPHRRRRTA